MSTAAAFNTRDEFAAVVGGTMKQPAATGNMATGGSGMPGVLKLVVSSFLEEEHYKTLYRVLSEQWSSCHSLTAAIKLMEAHGVRITKEEEARLLEFDEARMIDALVSKMPQQSREQFEHFFLQLSFIASTTKRMREALQDGDSQTTADSMESAENIGVLPHMLKMMVVQAGVEVRKREGMRDAWLSEQTEKMGPLLQAQASRMEVQKELAQERIKMGDYQSSAKDKGKKMLLNMAEGNDKNLMENIFGEWAKHVRQEKLEAEIVKAEGYEEKLALAKQKIIDFRCKHLANARSAMQKNFQDTQLGSLSTVFEAFKTNLEESRRRKAGGESLKEHEERLKASNAQARAKAQKAMANMNAGNDAFLVEMIFNLWIEALVEYKKDKEAIDKQRALDKQMADMLSKQSKGAMEMMKKMGAASETGLLAGVIKEWKEVVDDAKREEEVTQALNQKSSQLSAMAGKGKANAKNSSTRMSELQDLQVQMFCFCFWKREIQLQRVKQYGRNRNQKREKELLGVKSLFKDFANKLDKTLDQDTTTPRLQDKGAAKPKRESPPQPRSPQPPQPA